jgi:hypothetical protein
LVVQPHRRPAGEAFSASFWFKTAATAAAGFAVFLFVDTVFAYQYMTNRIARDQGVLLAVEEAASLEHRLIRGHIDTVEGLRLVLDATRKDRTDEIAWLGILNANGDTVASMPASLRLRYSAIRKQSGRASLKLTTRGGPARFRGTP